VLSFLRASFVPSRLPGMLAGMAGEAAGHVRALLLPPGGGARRADLAEAARLVTLRTGVVSVFGRAFADRHLDAAFEGHFGDFDSRFELGASPVPHLLQPRFRNARRALERVFREALDSGALEGSLALACMEASGVARGAWPNMLLTVLWASQANTSTSLFWVVGFLLLPEHAPHLARALGEVRDALPRGAGGGEAGGGLSWLGACGEGDLARACAAVAADRGSFIHRCMQEALRLRAPGIAVRMARSDLELARGRGERLSVPAGRMLAIMPLAIHMDPRYFPDRPWAFDPERAAWDWAGRQGAMRRVPGPRGLAGCVFGGGEYRCPGRFFAEAELTLLALIILSSCKFTLPPPAAGAAAGAGAGGGAAATSGGGGAAGGLSLKNKLFGAGMKDHVQLAMEEAGAAGDSAAWVGESGDQHGVLPRMDLTRLVGMKSPAGPLMVDVEARAQR